MGEDNITDEWKDRYDGPYMGAMLVCKGCGSEVYGGKWARVEAHDTWHRRIEAIERATIHVEKFD